MIKKLALLLFLPSLSWGSCASGYSYQRTLTINHAQVSTNTLNYASFPVLISTNEVTFSTTSGSGGHLSTGYDFIISSDAAGQYLVNWDTETLQNVGVSTANVWARLDFSSSTDRVYYITYGNSGVTTYQGFSTATWDANYKGVWHFPNGTTLGLNDSTSDGYTLTNHGASTAAAGKIDGGVKFLTASSQYLESVSASFPASSDITVSYWANVATPGTNDGAFGFSTLSGASRFGAHAPFVDGNAYWDYGDSATGRLSVSIASYEGSWHYYTFTGKGNNTSQKIYVDGTQKATQSTGNAPTGISSDFSIGTYFSNYWNATADEFHLSTVVRSPSWILTEYNNQSAPTTFVTLGAETSCGGGAPAYVPVNRGMTIQGGKTKIMGAKVAIK